MLKKLPMRNLLSVFATMVAMLGAVPLAQAAALDRSLAVTDSDALRELDLRQKRLDVPSLGLASMLGGRSAGSADIFALPSMQKMRTSLEREFRDYQLYDLQPFDHEALFAPNTRFILAGIVNRMDRAFVEPETCGEIRLIYRPIANYGTEKMSRLPMTLNLILNAKSDGETCADVARRWLALDQESATGADLAERLTATGGALDSITRNAIHSIETNIQIGHAAADPNDFSARAEYLMKVFDYDEASKAFVESAMENQIDRDKILSDASLKAEFATWLLAPDNLAALDRGTVVIPEKFLATRAITVTPAVDSGVEGLMADSDVVAALAKATTALENIKSPAGFERRLSDATCTGCHQTRAIGGFHFSGTDWSGDAKGAIVAVASPHFVGDQPRRRDILNSTGANSVPDFSRGFAARPQQRRSGDLANTTYFNGWGASCYPAAFDASFASWDCAEGLTCQMPDGGKPNATRAGLCFPKSN